MVRCTSLDGNGERGVTAVHPFGSRRRRGLPVLVAWVTAGVILAAARGTSAQAEPGGEPGELPLIANFALEMSEREFLLWAQALQPIDTVTGIKRGAYLERCVQIEIPIAWASGFEAN